MFRHSYKVLSIMAPIQRRAELTPVGIMLVVSLVVLVTTGVFCAMIFCKVCSKQRRREAAMRRMQEEQTPFVGVPYAAPADAQSNSTGPQIPQELHGQQRYYGPLELQGSGRPGPQPPQQLDGYVAAVSFVQTRKSGIGKLTRRSQPSMTPGPLKCPRVLYIPIQKLSMEDTHESARR